jgi:hypothetical protein
MVSSVMLRRVALVRTDASEELSASFTRVTRIGELGTTLDAYSSSETSVLTRATRRNVQEDTILHMLDLILGTRVRHRYLVTLLLRHNFKVATAFFSQHTSGTHTNKLRGP